ncbi:MAG: hypothetical protein Kow002_18710 [Anaerolineales bacterium]
MKLKLFVFLVFAALVLAGCGTGGQNSGITVGEVPAEYQGWENPLGGPEAIEAGKQIYERTCAPCHGVTGKGDGPASASLVPPPVDFSELYPLVGEDYYYYVIREGVPGTSMVSWKSTLTDEEIYQVIAYVREFK